MFSGFWFLSDQLVVAPCGCFGRKNLAKNKTRTMITKVKNKLSVCQVVRLNVLVPNDRLLIIDAKLSRCQIVWCPIAHFFLSWCQVVRLLPWCQIVCVYYLGANLSGCLIVCSRCQIVLPNKCKKHRGHLMINYIWRCAKKQRTIEYASNYLCCLFLVIVDSFNSAFRLKTLQLDFDNFFSSDFACEFIM